MKLELGKIYIRDVQFAEKTYVENGTLYVCKEEIEKLRKQSLNALDAIIKVIEKFDEA